MVTQFVPAPIAWDAVIHMSNHVITVPVVGWLNTDTDTVITLVFADGKQQSLNGYMAALKATTYELGRV